MRMGMYTNMGVESGLFSLVVGRKERAERGGC